ncbi:PAS domain S-box protein [Maridesulfovibrio zosterae]|uniref:PAS domain S-box protein n=1 Tax=Maridesulfovibrio zosterae TaxID=82171 RepID=UPI000408B568|nr:PAS domain S-box protein [Maridesulfovibrio zosterae]
MSIRIQEQVLYEIAMAMGTSLDLDKMLSTALSTYLRRLLCMGATVFLEKDGGERRGYEKVFFIPRKKRNNIDADIFFERINGSLNGSDYVDLMNDLPIHTVRSGNHFYLMELPEVGFLMVTKGKTPLSQSMLKSLHKLNVKLAESIISCLIYKRNKTLNIKLQNQIKGRMKAESILLAEREKYRAIYEGSPLGIVYYDHEGTIIDCNIKFAEIMGTTCKKLIGFKSATISSDKVRKVIEKALKGYPVIYEDYYTSVIGERTVYLRASFNPVVYGSKTQVVATVEELDSLKS